MMTHTPRIDLLNDAGRRDAWHEPGARKRGLAGTAGPTTNR